jgi:pyruvate-formate lyase-activating enzyme
MFNISPNDIPNFPSIVVVALTNACTHKCTFCQYQYYSTDPDYQLKNMSFTVFKKIVDEMSNYEKTALRLCAWGEPLLHPDIVAYVEYASSKNVQTVLLTNGYPLNPDLSLKLMKAGLNFVEVSIDAAYIETYREVRKCNDKDAFNKVKYNVTQMLKLRNEKNLATKIVVSHVTWPNEQSEKEFLKFREKWNGLVDDVVKRRLHSFACAVNPDLIKVPENRLPCYGLWGRGIVNPWGKIVICYNQWEKEKWALADLNDEDVSIASTWTGDRLIEMRHEQVNGVFTGPCADCKDYNPYAWDHPFEEVIERTKNEKKYSMV